MHQLAKETYWPLAAEVVKNYKLFADDIKRDLRIAKAMGFETIRLHHLEMLYDLDEKTRDEFLDFYLAELKHLGLTALLDVKLKPDTTVTDLDATCPYCAKPMTVLVRQTAALLPVDSPLPPRQPDRKAGEL